MKEKKIEIPGFSTIDNDAPVDHNCAIGLYGLEGSGKTNFLVTAPGPVGVIPLDKKTRFTVQKVAKELGKVVLMPDEDFIRHANPVKLSLMNEKDAKTYYSDHVKRVMDATYKLLAHPDIRTICVDSGTQLWEDILFKHYARNQRIMPRDRGPANQDMIDFLNAATGKHFLITFKAKAVWKNDAPTGEMEPSGFNGMGYHLTVMCEMKKNTSYNVETGQGGGKDWQFSLSVKNCQANASIQGPQGVDILTDGMVSFANLAMQIFPDADPDEFD